MDEKYDGTNAVLWHLSGQCKDASQRVFMQIITKTYLNRGAWLLATCYVYTAGRVTARKGLRDFVSNWAAKAEPLPVRFDVQRLVDTFLELLFFLGSRLKRDTMSAVMGSPAMCANISINTMTQAS